MRCCVRKREAVINPLKCLLLALTLGACGASPTPDTTDMPIDDETENEVEPSLRELSIRYSLSLALLAEHEYAAAWPHLEVIIDYYQDSWVLHLGTAQICLYWSMDYQCAREHATTALELRPNNARAHEYLGQAAEETGEPSTAISEYRRSFELRPTEAGVAVRLATLLDRQGDRQNAIDVLLEALGFSRNDARLMLRLAALYEEDNPHLAQRYYLEAAVVHEEPIVAYRHLLRFYERQGLVDEAEQIRLVIDEALGERHLRPL